jgi:hypothetical protein
MVKVSGRPRITFRRESGKAVPGLHEELTTQQGTVERLRSEGPSKELDQAQARLEALQDAARRNERQPITDANFESFFGVNNESDSAD